MIRRVNPTEAERVSLFLDRNTWSLRWLVAFFRHFDQIPEEARPYWGFWLKEELGSAEAETLPEIQAVLAHSFHTGVSFFAAAPGVRLNGLEGLLAREVLPERLTGDSEAIEQWMQQSPDLFEGVHKRERIRVLDREPEKNAKLSQMCPEFRLAGGEDVPVLKQFEQAYSLETGEDAESDFESLIDARLVFVFEEEGTIRGTLRSNLSDGRYVHAGGLYVHPCFRGKGIGRKMIESLAAQVCEKEQAGLVVDVSENSPAALRTYQQAGFREVGQADVLFIGEKFWEAFGESRMMG